jgi:hypothetical protein
MHENYCLKNNAHVVKTKLPKVLLFISLPVPFKFLSADYWSYSAMDRIIDFVGMQGSCSSCVGRLILNHGRRTNAMGSL